MSKIMKKLSRSKNVSISVKMEFLEVMGTSVVDKDMFCVHWTMKGLRGRENTGVTENVRATVSGNDYPVAHFNEVFVGEVHARPRKDGNGYEEMDFEMRVIQPALHKKDEKVLGKAIINIFDKVATLTPSQPFSQEQTVGLVEDGSAVAHIKLTFVIGDAAAAPEESETAEAEQASSPTSVTAAEQAPSHLVVKTLPASPAKSAGSESASSGTGAEGKLETESKRHKRHRSNSSAAALKKKEEELKEKEEAFEAEKKELNGKIEAQSSEIDELKKTNEYLESRVRKLEQEKEPCDVAMMSDEELLKATVASLQEKNDKLKEDNAAAEEKIAKLTEELEAAKKQQAPAEATASADDSKDKELALLKEQIAELRSELGKKSEAAPAAAAPAKNNTMMMAIVGAAGAVLGIIIGYLI